MCTRTAISYPKHQISPIIRMDRGMGLRLAADHVDPLISDVDFFFFHVRAILVAPMLIFSFTTVFVYPCGWSVVTVSLNSISVIRMGGLMLCSGGFNYRYIGYFISCLPFCGLWLLRSFERSGRGHTWASDTTSLGPGSVRRSLTSEPPHTSAVFSRTSPVHSVFDAYATTT